MTEVCEKNCKKKTFSATKVTRSTLASVFHIIILLPRKYVKESVSNLQQQGEMRHNMYAPNNIVRGPCQTKTLT